MRTHSVASQPAPWLDKEALNAADELADGLQRDMNQQSPPPGRLRREVLASMTAASNESRFPPSQLSASVQVGFRDDANDNDDDSASADSRAGLQHQRTQARLAAAQVRVARVGALIAAETRTAAELEAERAAARARRRGEPSSNGASSALGGKGVPSSPTARMAPTRCFFTEVERQHDGSEQSGGLQGSSSAVFSQNAGRKRFGPYRSFIPIHPFLRWA